jgi:hypothetical protein
MGCIRCNVIQVRKRDGTCRTATRCANSSAAWFTQDVTEEQCSACPYREEPAAIPSMPGPVRRLFTWAEAVAGWVAAGSPERSEEEVARIYHTFCAGTPACSWLDSDKQSCRGCGCRVTRDGAALFNKIKMATQHCPRMLW